jgi:hypothetical protein
MGYYTDFTINIYHAGKPVTISNLAGHRSI